MMVSGRIPWDCIDSLNLIVCWNANSCSTRIPVHKFQYLEQRHCITYPILFTCQLGTSRNLIKERTNHSEPWGWMIPTLCVLV
jgi:hypothetical protein